jgi:WD40 repeat protein
MSRYIRLLVVDVHRNTCRDSSNVLGAGENLIDMLQLIEFCGDYCIVLNGDNYGNSMYKEALDSETLHIIRRRGYDTIFDKKLSSFDVQARHALNLSKSAQTRSAFHTSKAIKDGTLCFLKSKQKQQQNNQQSQHHDRKKSLEIFCRSMDDVCHIVDYTSKSVFSEKVYNILKARLQKQFQVKKCISWFEKERICNAVLRQYHMANGDGVPGLLEGVAESVKLNTGMSPVVVLGSQGIGKSHSMAVLADFIETAGEEWVLISHFVGASTASKKVCSTLARMIFELMNIDEVTSNGLNAHDISNLLNCKNYPSLCTLFRVSFNQTANYLASLGKTLVILIDGIDQLEVGRLEWLPTIVPQNAQFVLSSFKSSPAMKLLWYRYGQLQTFDLDANPMPMMQLVSVLKNLMVQRGTFNEGELPEEKLLLSILQKHKRANLQYVRAVAWHIHRGMTRGQSVLGSDFPKTTRKLLEEEVHQADVDLREWFVRHVRNHGETLDAESLAKWVASSSELFASIMSAIWVSRILFSFDELTDLVLHVLNTLWTMKDKIDSENKLRPSPKLIVVTLVNSLGIHIGAGLKSGHLRKLGFVTTAMQDCIGNMFLKTPILRARAQGIMAAFCLNIGDPSATGTWFPLIVPSNDDESEKNEKLQGEGELYDIYHQWYSIESTTEKREGYTCAGAKTKRWRHAVIHVVEYQLAGHEVLGLRATLCNPWYLMARCQVAKMTPLGINDILTDFQRSLECLADPLYISLHCSIYIVNDSNTFENELHRMTDALTEFYQFVLHRQKELSRRPELCLQLALSEWMTHLPSNIVSSGNLAHRYALFSWKNKPIRPPRLTAHVGYCNPITSCAVSYPDTNFAFPGKLAAIGFQDGQISIINTLSGGTLFSLENEDTLGAQYRLNQSQNSDNRKGDYPLSIDTIAFSSDNRIIVGKQGGDILFWLLPSGDSFFRLPTTASTSFSMCGNLSSSSDMLLVGNESGYVSLWHIASPLNNLEDITLVSENYHGSNASITATACSSNSTFVISGSQAGVLIIWRIEQGGLNKNATIDSGYFSPITSLSFRSDGLRIAACSEGDPTVKVWDMHGSMSREMCVDNVGVSAVAWSDDMRTLVTVPVNGTELVVWDAESSGKITRLTGHHKPVSCIDFVWIPTSPETVMCSLLTGCDDCLVRFWNFSGMVPGATGRNMFLESDKQSLEKRVATVSEKGKTTTLLTELCDDNTYRLRTSLSGHNDSVLCCTTSLPIAERENFVNFTATGGKDGAVRLWSIPAGQHIATVMSKSGSSIHCIGISKDCSVLSFWEESGYLHVWKVTHRNTLTSTSSQITSEVILLWSVELTSANGSVVKTLTFDSDICHLICCKSDGYMCRFDVTTGKLVNSNTAKISKVSDEPENTAAKIKNHFVLDCTCNIEDGYIDIVDTAGVVRSYDLESLSSTGPGECLLSYKSSKDISNVLIGSWMDTENEQAHAVSVLNNSDSDNSDVRNISVTPGCGSITVKLLQASARCISFAVSTPPNWLAIGWDDGLVHICRIIGSGSISLIGSVVTPAPSKALSISESYNVNVEQQVKEGEEAEDDANSCSLCLVCGDISGNVCVFTTNVNKKASTKELQSASLEMKKSRATWKAMNVPECVTLFEDDGVDRSNIKRNAHGSEEPHSDDPELWNIDGTEVDYFAIYKSGGQLWYLQSRAKESLAKVPPKPIPGVPLNKKAIDSGRIFVGA